MQQVKDALMLSNLWCSAVLQLLDLDASALMTQQQQLQQQRPGADILVIAADVRDNKAMARAVREHMARWVCLKDAF